MTNPRRRRQTRTRRTDGFPPEIHNAAIARAHQNHAAHLAAAAALAEIYNVPHALLVVRRRRSMRILAVGNARIDWLRFHYVDKLLRLAITHGEAEQLDAALADDRDYHHDERAAARDRTLNGTAKCTRCITADSDTPPHDPSPRCSAAEPHCTCTTCL